MSDERIENLELQRLRSQLPFAQWLDATAEKYPVRESIDWEFSCAVNEAIRQVNEAHGFTQEPVRELSGIERHQLDETEEEYQLQRTGYHDYCRANRWSLDTLSFLDWLATLYYPEDIERVEIENLKRIFALPDTRSGKC